jgi:hypothetical protein
VTARMRQAALRRSELLEQCARDRAQLAQASGALIAPLAVADLGAAAVQALRHPPAQVAWAARLLRVLRFTVASRAVRIGWGTYVAVTTSARALRAVRRAERGLA